MTKIVRRSSKKRMLTPAPAHLTYKGSVRHFAVGQGLPSPTEIRDELEGYEDVLNGRVDPPIFKGVITLMEVANGYYSRACELERKIYRAKAEGWLPKNVGYESLRTQEIRSFKELCKGATELGSRRITFENLRFQQENRGLESL